MQKEFILGTWAFGDWWWGGSNRDESLRTLDTALDDGALTLDTAPVYGFTQCEALIGEWLSSKKERYGNVKIWSKCGLVWDNQSQTSTSQTKPFFVTEFQNRSYHVFRFLNFHSILNECENSLRRLKRDFIDVYFIHWTDCNASQEEIASALERLSRDGKILSVGVSNHSVDQFLKLKKYIKNVPLTHWQSPYHLLYRKAEDSFIPYCKKNRIGFYAYSPLAQGFLCGRLTRESFFLKGDMRASHPSLTDKDFFNRLSDAFDNIKEISSDKKVTPAQLALAWIYHQSGVSGIICGARSPKQFTENKASLALTLTQEENQRIGLAFEDVPFKIH